MIPTHTHAQLLTYERSHYGQCGHAISIYDSRTKRSQPVWSRRGQFPVVRSARRMVWIVRFRPFCKNILGLLRNNQTAARPPLSGNFAKKAPNFSQNQSKVQQSRFKEICKKNLKFVKSTRRPDPLSEFLKKNSQILIKSNDNLFHPFSYTSNIMHAIWTPKHVRIKNCSA